MRSIRKLAYATVLSASLFCVQPTLAATEEACGCPGFSHEESSRGNVLRAVNSFSPAPSATARELRASRKEMAAEARQVVDGRKAGAGPGRNDRSCVQ